MHNINHSIFIFRTDVAVRKVNKHATSIDAAARHSRIALLTDTWTLLKQLPSSLLRWVIIIINDKSVKILTTGDKPIRVAVIQKTWA